MKKIIKSFVCLFLITALSNTFVFAQNLLKNGDFESGVSVPGNYSFVTDPSLMNSSFISGDTIFTNLNWVTLPLLRFTKLFKK